MKNKASIYLGNDRPTQLSSIGEYEKMDWDDTMGAVGDPFKHIGSIGDGGDTPGTSVGITGKSNCFSSRITTTNQNFEPENVGAVG